MGLKALNQAVTQMDPNVMGAAPTTTLGGRTTSICITNPNVKFNASIIVLQPLLARTKISCLIQPLLIISRVIFRTYLFTPNMMEPTKNLIFVHHLTKQNNVFVEFHPFHFLVKDKITGVILLRGACNNGIYTFSASMVA
ncbi:hypothetical protein AAG906_013143 [Vitis piasezkii]